MALVAAFRCLFAGGSRTFVFRSVPQWARVSACESFGQSGLVLFRWILVNTVSLYGLILFRCMWIHFVSIEVSFVSVYLGSYVLGVSGLILFC